MSRNGQKWGFVYEGYVSVKNLNGSDRRVVRTKENLSQALFALIIEKPYERISIKDILERANVGRSTFYNHFQDKDDLLLSNVPENILELDLNENVLNPNLVRMFTDAEYHYALYKAMLGTGGISLLYEKIQQILALQIQQHVKILEGNGMSMPAPAPIIAQYLSGALWALFRQWLDEGMPYTPEQMNTMFQQLVMFGISTPVSMVSLTD